MSSVPTNLAKGQNALKNITQDTSYNIAFGNNAGLNVKTGNSNTFLGYNTDIDISSNTYTKSTAIGSGSIVTGSNQIVMGTNTELICVPGKTVIGNTVTSSSYTLDVCGTANFSSGNVTIDLGKLLSYPGGTTFTTSTTMSDTLPSYYQVDISGTTNINITLPNATALKRGQVITFTNITSLTGNVLLCQGSDKLYGDALISQGSSSFTIAIPYVVLEVQCGGLNRWNILSYGSSGSTGSQGLQGAQGSQGSQGNSGVSFNTSASSGLNQVPVLDSSVNLTVGTQLPYIPGNSVIVNKTSDPLNYSFEGTVYSYNTITGEMTIYSIKNIVGTWSGVYTTSVNVNLDGIDGPQGNTGTQGATGSQGLMGPQGSQGNTGATGSIGEQGAQGSQGSQGNTGATGEQGVQGSQGNTGATGEQGVQGSQGNTGATGPQGVTGPTLPILGSGGTGSVLVNPSGNNVYYNTALQINSSNQIITGSNLLPGITGGGATGYSIGSSSYPFKDITVYNKFLTTDNSNNILIGKDVSMGTTVTDNIAIGRRSLNGSQGNRNIGIGSYTLDPNTNNMTGSDNIALGYNSLTECTTGTNNVSIGYSAMSSSTVGSNNVSIGVNSFSGPTNPQTSVVIGNNAATNCTSAAGLVVIGNEAAVFSTTPGTGMVAIGYQALRSNQAARCIAIGYQSLYANTTGIDNLGIGYSSLRNNTIGTNNIGIGTYTLNANIGGSWNTALGYQALYSNTNGNANTAIGYAALNANTTGIYNTAIGYQSLASSSTASYNTAIGYQTLSNCISDKNIAIGYRTLYYNQLGNNNIALGDQTLTSNISGDYNIAIGGTCMYNNVGGSENVVIGKSSLGSTDASYNSVVGNQSMFVNKTGSYNCTLGALTLFNSYYTNNSVAIGYQCFRDVSSGSGNVGVGYNTCYTGRVAASRLTLTNCSFLGTSSDLSSNITTCTQSTAIGYNAKITGNNQIVMGTNTELMCVPGKTVIGNTVTSSSYTMDICGTANISGATTLSNTLAITGDISVNTNKFNITAASGNTTIAGNLDLSGNLTTDLGKLFSYPGGTTFTTSTTMSDTLSSYYQVDISGSTDISINLPNATASKRGQVITFYNLTANTGNALVCQGSDKLYGYVVPSQASTSFTMGTAYATAVVQCAGLNRWYVLSYN